MKSKLIELGAKLIGGCMAAVMLFVFVVAIPFIFLFGNVERLKEGEK